ncbi:MAG: hypothetical protein ABSH05_18360 [Bryobacteraceae bacterium]
MSFWLAFALLRASRILARHDPGDRRAAALHLDYAIGTLNPRHFRLIPGLKVVEL